MYKNHHTHINLYLDVKHAEDLQFDRLLGKMGSLKDSSGEPRPWTDVDTNASSEFELPVPTIPKKG
jgi:hypothetical protein